MTRRLLIALLLGLCVVQTDAQLPLPGGLGRFGASTGPAVLLIGTPSLGDGVNGTAYTCPEITATGGTTPYTWSTVGTLPTGVTITDSGNVAVCGGTPSADGTFAFFLKVTDNNGVIATLPVQIVVASSLPAGWTSGDLGQIGNTAGTVAYNAGTGVFTLTSSGANILGTSDNFRYACTTITDDGAITAEITSFTGYTFAQAGVMIRNSLEPDAAHLFAHWLINDSNQRKFRASDGASTTNESTGNSGHSWVRVTRTDDVLTGFTSADGVTWAQAAGAQTITMGSVVYACLAVTNIQTTSVATVSFDNVVVDDTEPTPPPEPDTDYGGYRPSYQGFGATSVGGRGAGVTPVLCAIDRLTNASAGSQVQSNPFSYHRGSLRYCLELSVPRFVIAETSGYIVLTSPIAISNPYVTIALQTAPSPGLTIRGSWFQIDTHDVVFQHVRLRPGAAAGSQVLGFHARGLSASVYNLVLDHISCSWSGYLCVVAHNFGATPSGPQPQDILITDSIIAENFPLNTLKPVGVLLYGVGCNGTITATRNYFAHLGSRMPYMGSGWRGSWINNLSYDVHASANEDGQFGFVQLVGAGDYWECVLELAYVGNVNVGGPNTNGADSVIKIVMDSAQATTGGGYKVYLADNTGPAGQYTVAGSGTACGGSTADNQWDRCVAYHPTPYNFGNRANTECDATCYATTFGWHTSVNYQLLANAAVQASVVANAGARPLDRDSVDSRLVLDVSQGDGTFISTETTVGGYPTLATNTRSLLSSVPANPFSVAAGQSFRTNVELWLEDCAKEVEDGSEVCVP